MKKMNELQNKIESLLFVSSKPMKPKTLAKVLELAFLNADLREALTDATIEVLAIIAYRQPISKAEIESIRGVNSQYSIRALLMRGLIEKVANPHDSRGAHYQVTTEFMQQLGITSIKDLPSFEEIAVKVRLPDVPATKDMQKEVAPENE
jgi:chromosome segregation and condensation protein ScpB